MNLSFCCICSLASCVVVNAATNDFAYSSNEKSHDVHPAEYVKSPVVMCAPVQDAISAFESYAGSQWDWANMASGSTIAFERNVGLFSSATITLFNPPNCYLRHHLNSYGQVETIASTAEVQVASLEAGVLALDVVRHMYEERLGKDLFETKMREDFVQYQTKSPTASGWRIELTAKRPKDGVCFFKMKIFRKRFEARKELPMPEVELALP